MPVMDGFEATKRIMEVMGREVPQRREGGESNRESDEEERNELCHVVALTAYSSAEVEEKCKALGMKSIV